MPYGGLTLWEADFYHFFCDLPWQMSIPTTSSLALLDDLGAKETSACQHNTVTTVLDDREHGLRRLLPQIRPAHLPVGDIWIGLSGEAIAPNGLVIERKAVADLEASILDGRYREQRARLLGYCSEHKAHPIYCIEGDLDRLYGARLKKPALLKHLTRLSLRYHITVFQTASIEETAELIKILMEQWQDDPKAFEQPAQLSYVDARGSTRTSNSDDPEIFAVSVLQCCRGISSTGAQAILKACGGTLTGVWNAEQGALAAIPMGKQKVGPARAKRLYELLHKGAGATGHTQS